MRLGGRETSRLQHRPDQLVVETEHSVQELAVIDVVRLLVTVELHGIGNHLLLGNVFEH